MTEREDQESHESAIGKDRVGEVVQNLSDRNGKTLDLMRDPVTGELFVRRAYEPGAEQEFEVLFQGGFLSFSEALAAMKDMYSRAGLSVVKSEVVNADGAAGVVMISEYLPELKSYYEATFEARELAMEGFGKMLDLNSPFFPGVQAMVSDVCMFVEEDGVQKPVIVDTDPRLRVKIEDDSFFGSNKIADSNAAFFMNRVNDLIELWAQTGADRAALARAFLKGASSLDQSLIPEGERATEALFEIHHRTQKLDLDFGTAYNPYS